MEESVYHLTEVEQPQDHIAPIVLKSQSRPFFVSIEKCQSAILDIEEIAASSYLFAKTAQNPHKLTQPEIAAIHLYTTECDFYRTLNKALRQNNRKDLNPFLPYLKLLVLGLNKLPSHSGKVWRGVKLNLKEDYPEGKKFCWLSFSSWTADLKVLEEYCGMKGERTMFCVNSVGGRDVKMYSDFPGEVILMPGYFVVKGVRESGAGCTVIDIEELPPPSDIFTEATQQNSSIPKSPRKTEVSTDLKVPTPTSPRKKSDNSSYQKESKPVKTPKSPRVKSDISTDQKDKKPDEESKSKTKILEQITKILNNNNPKSKLPTTILKFYELKGGDWYKRTESVWTKKLLPGSKSYTLFENIFEKLDGKQFILESVSAVHNEPLWTGFSSYYHILHNRIQNEPLIYDSKEWKMKKDADLKFYYNQEFSNFHQQFEWNNGERLPIIPVIQGTDMKTAMRLCENGYHNLSSLDGGWYGNGIYFSSSVTSAFPFFATKPQPAIIIALVVPGNSYPTTEMHDGMNSLMGRHLVNGHQSHFLLSDKRGLPIQEIGKYSNFEIVIEQDFQIVPIYVLKVSKENFSEIMKKNFQDGDAQ